MSKYYTIQITSGTTAGPYNIYYDLIDNNYFAQFYPSGTQTSGLSLAQLQSGVNVEVPDTANYIYVFNPACNNSEVFNLNASSQKKGSPKESTCLCLEITDIITKVQVIINVCDSGNIVNDRPSYTNGTESIEWNLNGYWELIGYTAGATQFRSIYYDDIPDSSWLAVGPSAANYSVTSQIGDCGNLPPQSVSFNVSTFDPTCYNVNNGTIYAVATGGAGGWTYSLDGLYYSNNTGLFTSLPSNQYTVYGKDSNDLVISQTVVLSSSATTYFSLPGVVSVSQLSSVGNMKYYLAKIEYNTSAIPLGETVNFDLSVNYDLIFVQPGSVIFDTNKLSVVKNSINQTIVNTTTLPLTAVQPSTCDQGYYEYNGSDYYSSPGLSLVNGDIFTVNVVYGIDTETYGGFDGLCYTTASTIINVIFDNLISSCQCCTMNNNLVNISEPPQIYQL